MHFSIANREGLAGQEGMEIHGQGSKPASEARVPLPGIVPRVLPRPTCGSCICDMAVVPCVPCLWYDLCRCCIVASFVLRQWCMLVCRAMPSCCPQMTMMSQLGWWQGPSAGGAAVPRSSNPPGKTSDTVAYYVSPNTIILLNLESLNTAFFAFPPCNCLNSCAQPISRACCDICFMHMFMHD